MFGRYQLERRLGGGGMAVVWLAHDQRLNRPVALKFLSDALFRDVAAREDMKKETRHSLELTHPNIVRIYDFVEDDEAAAIAMEYVEGSTLSQLRADRPQRCFEVDELRAWVAELCSALEYAHREAGVVHRDLKPANLLVTSRGSVKIADFGLSRPLRSSMTAGENRGTLCYMSPQQLAGEMASESDDIYALGATLYELLTGKPPFILGDIASHIRTVTPERMAERRVKLSVDGEAIPEPWEDTVAACLSKFPSGRPSSAGEIACFLGIKIERSNHYTTPLSSHVAPVPSSSAQLAARLLQEEVERPTASVWPEAQSVALRVTSPPSTSLECRRGHRALSRKVLLLSLGAAAAPLMLAVGLMLLPGKYEQLATAQSIPRASSPSTTPAVESPMVNAVPPAVPKPPPPSLAIVTTPPGIPFHILSVADADAHSSATVETGQSPANFDGLQPGAYHLVLGGGRWPERSLPFQLEEGGKTTLVRDLPHGTVRIESQPPGAEIYEGDTFLGTTPVSIPAPPGRHVFVAMMDDNKTISRTVDMTADETKDIRFDLNSTPSSRGGREIAHHRRRPRHRAPETMLAKIGRSIKEGLIKAEAVVFPHPPKDRKLWD